MNYPPFCPSPWFPGSHAQTLGARLIRSRMGGVEFRRERLTLPDGDFLDLDWAERVRGATVGSDAALTLVVHGLEGSAKSGYAKELYRGLGARGVATVGMNFRSCSGELNRLPRTYHSGETGDLSYVLNLLRNRFPSRPLGVVGVSLGGNVLLKHLGEAAEDGRDKVWGAAAISVPFDLAAGADYVERGFSKVYRWSLVSRLKKKVVAKAAILDGHVDMRRILEARTFRTFDDVSTAPLHGFIDAEDYYRRSSSLNYLNTIRVPTLLIQSLDDPFLPATSVPYDRVGENPCIKALISKKGGHVGFVEGPPWSPTFWAEQTAASYLADRLQSNSMP